MDPFYASRSTADTALFSSISRPNCAYESLINQTGIEVIALTDGEIAVYESIRQTRAPREPQLKLVVVRFDILADKADTCTEQIFSAKQKVRDE